MVRYRTAQRTVLESEWQQTCDAMIAALGPASATDYPRVERLQPGSSQAAAVLAGLPRTLPTPPPAPALAVAPPPRAAVLARP